MLLFPKRPKFLKSFSNKQISAIKQSKKKLPAYANIVLVASQSGFLTNFQIEALRRNLLKFVKRQGKLLLPIFPLVPITKKPNEIRLGRGKAQPRY
jgi:large subunit ribosomal protein L16